MYNAKVIRVQTLVPIEKADNLLLLKYNGYQFVVGKDINVGDLVVLFPTDGQLSEDFCKENNLYSDSSKNKDTTKKGYFSDNRRVKAQRFRGENSEGFVVTLGMFSYLGKFDFTENLEFDTINGKLVCEKYYTPQTRRKMVQTPQGKKQKDVEYGLREHFDTSQLAYNYDRLPEKGVYIITEKIHGTSARTGNVLVKREKQTFFQRMLSSIFKRKFATVSSAYEYVSGTRHTVINNRKDITEPGNQDSYRWDWHKFFEGKLRKGETIYYEIVGWDSLGGTIMGSHDIQKLKKDKNLPTWFANQMVFSYGCKENTNAIFVYRITVETDDNLIELSWEQVKGRCKGLGVNPVPELFNCVPHSELGVVEEVKQAVKRYIVDNDISFADGSHLIEGIVVRIETEGKIVCYKDKNFWFKVLEGIIKQDDNYVDTEEVN